MASLSIIILSIALILFSHEAHSQDITNEDIVCIATAVGSVSQDCTDLVTLLSNLYNSDNALQSVSGELGQFPIFCNPQCGQAIVGAWQSCGVFEEIEAFANLFIGMCATNQDGTVCYTMYNELIAFINTIRGCGVSSTDCSQQCMDDIRDAVSAHGCCVNAPLLFQGSMEEDFTETSVTAFFSCGTTRPGVCSFNGFNNLPPPPTLPPASPSPASGSQQPPSGQPGARPSKGVGHVATLLQVVVVFCFSLVLMM